MMQRCKNRWTTYPICWSRGYLPKSRKSGKTLEMQESLKKTTKTTPSFALLFHLGQKLRKLCKVGKRFSINSKKITNLPYHLYFLPK
jgi:hypothetical protein